jgi:hypothetical protein
VRQAQKPLLQVLPLSRFLLLALQRLVLQEQVLQQVQREQLVLGRA